MSDLIRRSKLLDSLPKNDTVLSLDVRKIVLDAPAVDAAPVVHGRWIPRNDEWFDFFQCSACHVPFWAMRAYCPNCGAKMDGEGDAK